MPSVAELKVARKKTVNAYRVFESPDGEIVMDDLTMMFDVIPHPNKDSTDAFVFTAGCRSVLDHIKTMIARNQNV